MTNQNKQKQKQKKVNKRWLLKLETSISEQLSILNDSGGDNSSKQSVFCISLNSLHVIDSWAC